VPDEARERIMAEKDLMQLERWDRARLPRGVGRRGAGRAWPSRGGPSAEIERRAVNR
jgi:hypothetical protein